MKKISGVMYNNKSIIGFATLCKVWREVMPEIVTKITTPTRINAKGEMTVLVHDNIWLTDLGYMREELAEKLTESGFPVKSLIFKYSPAYTRIDKPKRQRYEIGEPQKYFIESISERIENKELAKSFEGAITSYFKNYTIDEFTKRT